MFQARQKVLLEQTNQSILAIRQTEIAYYSSLNSAFGLQAAILGGFVFVEMFDNARKENNDQPHHNVRLNMYCVFASIVVATALHIIITTTLLKVCMLLLNFTNN